jgi:hypothetical protein
MFRGQMGRIGLTRHLPTYDNMTNFLLLNPDFFFGRQRASTKGCARALFLGWLL